MQFTPAWRNFRRMQDIAAIFASLVYAGATLHAWTALPGPPGLKFGIMVAFPAAFLVAVFALALRIGAVRTMLQSFLWMTFKTGFGQTAISVLTPLAVLAAAAVLIYLETAGVARGGKYPAGVFSGYGAGIGVLIAQAVLTRKLQDHPEVKAEIEERG